MIIEDNRANIEANGMLVESFFNVKQENLAHVFSILRNQLYSDKVLAIVREYSTNAYDAHVDAGIGEKPIQIKCPSYFDLSLHIRDFGFGLSEEDVFNIFASYGESTKRNTNSQVGMMGLGSKSAFCYSDSFTIVSYNNGEKKIYSAYIDDSGIGKISKVNTESTNETGLEIQIPVKRHDVYNFHNTLIAFLREFNPKPIITNESTVEEKINDFNPKIILNGNGWEIREVGYGTNHFCIMGNVMYPVNINNIDLDEDSISSIRYLGGNVIIFANIGDVKPNASREMLDYIPMTKQFLREKFNSLIDEMKDRSISKIVNSASYWEAKINFGLVSKFIPSKDRNLNYKGLILNSDFIKVESPVSIYRKFNDNKWQVHSVIKADSNDTIFIYKGNVPRKSIFVRAQSYMAENDLDVKKTYLLGFENEEIANNWLALGYLDGAKTIDVATIPYIFRKKDRVLTQYEKAEIYSLTLENFAYKNRDNWKAVNVEVPEYEQLVYVPIKYYSPVDCHITSDKYGNALEQLFSFIKEFKHYGIPTPLNIYGIPAKNVKDLGDNWIHFDSYVQQCLDTMTESERMNILFTSNYNKINHFWLKLAKELGPDDATGFYEIAEKWQNCKQMNRISTERLTGFGFYFDNSEVKEINDKQNELLEKYPLLKLTNPSYMFDYIPELVKYIKSV